MELISVILIIASLLPFSASDHQGHALYDMKLKLHATGTQLSDWNQNQVNSCTWNFVICDSNNNVVQVTLASMGFTGVLSPRIGDLEYLNVLSLPGNKITGVIPVQFGNLSRLTSLDLEDNLLEGVIPASLGHLSKLQLLILSENMLIGSIPYTLAAISSLTDIRLAYNNLSGSIPSPLFQVARYNFSGNNLICGANFLKPCASSVSYQGASRGSKIGIVLGTVGGVIGLLIIGALFIICNGRRKSHLREIFVDVSGEDDRRIAFGQLKRFTWRELQLATDNFSEKNVLGQGGFGKVYKGALPDGTKIAVKRLTDYESPGGEAAFLREVELISVAVHRNLLRLIGFCTTQTERLLVYPFMQNLSVAYRLRDADHASSRNTDADHASSTATEAVLIISPNGKFKRNIKSWMRGALLGSGSFGMVYEGMSDEGAFFAVKEVSLLDQGSNAQQSILALEQEIVLLSQFEHENIVQYYGTDKEESKLYIFIELVTQGSLSSLYQKYKLQDSQVSAYTRQILNGLVYLHERNVVHRDIKCANILVHASGSVKLADFGLAKEMSKINMLRSCKGSVYWMAPEVVNPRKTYGPPADMWSLGCTVLEMLTRQIPYPNVEWTNAFFMIGRGEQPPIPGYLSKEAQDFISQCVRVDAEKRPSASQLLTHPFVNRPL